MSLWDCACEERCSFPKDFIPKNSKCADCHKAMHPSCGVVSSKDQNKRTCFKCSGDLTSNRPGKTRGANNIFKPNRMLLRTPSVSSSDSSAPNCPPKKETCQLPTASNSNLSETTSKKKKAKSNTKRNDDRSGRSKHKTSKPKPHVEYDFSSDSSEFSELIRRPKKKSKKPSPGPNPNQESKPKPRSKGRASKEKRDKSAGRVQETTEQRASKKTTETSGTPKPGCAMHPPLIDPKLSSLFTSVVDDNETQNLEIPCACHHLCQMSAFKTVSRQHRCPRCNMRIHSICGVQNPDPDAGLMHRHMCYFCHRKLHPVVHDNKFPKGSRENPHEEQQPPSPNTEQQSSREEKEEDDDDHDEDNMDSTNEHFQTASKKKPSSKNTGKSRNKNDKFVMKLSKDKAAEYSTFPVPVAFQLDSENPLFGDFKSTSIPNIFTNTIKGQNYVLGAAVSNKNNLFTIEFQHTQMESTTIPINLFLAASQLSVSLQMYNNRTSTGMFPISNNVEKYLFQTSEDDEGDAIPSDIEDDDETLADEVTGGAPQKYVFNEVISFLKTVNSPFLLLKPTTLQTLRRMDSNGN